MVLATGGFADDLSVAPAQASKVICECDSAETRGGGRAAPFANGDIILNPKRQRNDCFSLRFQNLAVGREDEMIFHRLADCFIASGRANRKTGRGAGVNDRSKEHTA